MRACYQFGSLTRKKRAKGPDAWEFRYYETTTTGERERKTATVGSVEKYKTKALAQKAVEALLLKLNSETPQQRMTVVTFGAICDRYLEEELPERYSTAKSYRSNIKNYLKPRWGDYLLEKIRPMAVEDWLKTLPMAPKSKTHIRSVMHLMYECATRWELFNEQRNPIALVRIKGGSKRRQRPIVLTVEQFELVVATLREPYRTMVQIAQCLGLRVSEIAALQWDDFDFDKNQLARSAQLRERAGWMTSRPNTPRTMFLCIPVLDRDRSEVEHARCGRRKKAGSLPTLDDESALLSHGEIQKRLSSPLGLLCGGMSDVRG